MTPSQSIGIILVACVAVWATLYKPSDSSAHSKFVQQSLVIGAGKDWDLNVPPSENATGHFVFQSVSSLLQHWPNTRYRNGHTIVPGLIRVGTTLYHGRSDSNYPKGAEWTATDPEHSFQFCKRPCWHLTLVTTRPLNILYFDGSSAVKMHGGSMDSQDILLWGERRADRVFSEEERLEQLCKWGRQFGMDGFVRMEMDFEVMLCDFASGVEPVSFLHLANASPSDPKPPSSSDEAKDHLPDPAETEIDSKLDVWIGGGLNPAVTIRNFELMHSSSQYNQYPGDTRIILDLSRLVSFYDPEVAPSLVRIRNSINDKGGRWLYDLSQIEPEDIVGINQKLHEVLENNLTRVSSGVDWQTLLQVIIKRFGSRLQNLRYVVRDSAHNSGSTILDDEDRILKAFAQINVMLTPYIPYDLKPNAATDIRVVENESHSATALAWASPAYELCSTSHTSYIANSLSERMTSSEKLLLGAVQDTTQEICRVLVKMWAIGVETGLDAKYWARRTRELDKRDQHDDRFGALAKQWSEQIEHLMDWLDWHMWVKCNPACSDEEMCYMPTWPFFGGPPPGPAASPESEYAAVTDSSENRNDWERPVPKCIRKLAPYSF
ncbi:hypothetical protein J3R30DRAFT_1142612 [Lentinula aciculospora]|uniref:Uncharacterized protein n=1 Tax=Lentinula aciculospora TaxID=153920 RepID=A0A9W9DIE2_9AGAR|nr:hypothetical protein J3R30DRAFT_1142612 [Lentinula aciculospora]